MGSPKRTRPTGSPKPGQNKLAVPLDGTATSGGTRTISRGKPRPGSAAATGSNLRGTKTGSASGSAKRVKPRGVGLSGSRAGGGATIPTMHQASTTAATGLGFHA